MMSIEFHHSTLTLFAIAALGATLSVNSDVVMLLSIVGDYTIAYGRVLTNLLVS